MRNLGPEDRSQDETWRAHLRAARRDLARTGTPDERNRRRFHVLYAAKGGNWTEPPAI